MKTHLTIFLILALMMSATPSWAEAGKSYEEQLEAAYTAADEGKYKESNDLLLAMVEQVPEDSLLTLSDIYGTLLENYFQLGDFEKALHYGRLGLDVDTRSGNKENISSSLSNLAAVCSNAERMDEAVSFVLRSILIEQELNRKDKLAIRLGLLSEFYTKQNRLEEALDMVKQALDLDKELGREDKVAVHLSQMGSTLMTMCRFDEALPVLQEAVNLHRKYQNLPSLALSLITLSSTQRALFHIKDAEKNLQECIELTEKIGFRQVRLAAYMELARLYNKAHDPHAFDYLSQFMNLKDSINEEQVEQQISNLKILYETQEKEQEIALQEATISRQRLLYIGLAVLLAIAMLALFLAYRALKLKEQNMRLKDRFIQLISHDLKNPAIAQQRNLHALLRCHQDLDKEAVDEQLTEMALASDAQVDLLYDLQDWAGLQTGRLKYEPIQLDLLSLAQKAIDLHRAQAQLKHIDITLQSEGEDHQVKADRQMVSTILRNILSNAIKFSTTGSSIEIVVNDHTIETHDHGVGFDTAHYQQQLGTDGEDGTALGLGLAHRLANINHAKLDITSEKERGTTVKLAF